MRPEQIAQFADLPLSISFSTQVQEVQKGSQAKADNKMLAEVERQQPTSVLLGKATHLDLVAVLLRSNATALQIVFALLFGVLVALATAVAIGADGAEIEHRLKVTSPPSCFDYTSPRIAHRLHIEAHAHPVGAGLLHHRMGKPAHVEHDLGMFERAVMASLTRQEPFHADFSGPGFIRPVVAISGHEALAVVLMHAGIHALLRVGGGSDQIDAEVGIFQWS